MSFVSAGEQTFQLVNYQIVSDAHGAVEFRYTWKKEDAEKEKAAMIAEYGNAEIRRKGNFIQE